MCRFSLKPQPSLVVEVRYHVRGDDKILVKKIDRARRFCRDVSRVSSCEKHNVNLVIAHPGMGLRPPL